MEEDATSKISPVSDHFDVGYDETTQFKQYLPQDITTPESGQTNTNDFVISSRFPRSIPKFCENYLEYRITVYLLGKIILLLLFLKLLIFLYNLGINRIGPRSNQDYVTTVYISKLPNTRSFLVKPAIIDGLVISKSGFLRPNMRGRLTLNISNVTDSTFNVPLNLAVAHIIVQHYV